LCPSTSTSAIIPAPICSGDPSCAFNAASRVRPRLPEQAFEPRRLCLGIGKNRFGPRGIGFAIDPLRDARAHIGQYAALARDAGGAYFDQRLIAEDVVRRGDSK
jgi:hypothetical protein